MVEVVAVVIEIVVNSIDKIMSNQLNKITIQLEQKAGVKHKVHKIGT